MEQREGKFDGFEWGSDISWSVPKMVKVASMCRIKYIGGKDGNWGPVMTLYYRWAMIPGLD